MLKNLLLASAMLLLLETTAHAGIACGVKPGGDMIANGMVTSKATTKS